MSTAPADESTTPSTLISEAIALLALAVSALMDLENEAEEAVA